jgi:hypothetical protein
MLTEGRVALPSPINIKGVTRTTIMSRGQRLTIRLEEAELEVIKNFADDNHVLASVALRWLISRGLAEHSASNLENKQDVSGPNGRGD